MRRPPKTARGALSPDVLVDGRVWTFGLAPLPATPL